MMTQADILDLSSALAEKVPVSPATLTAVDSPNSKPTLSPTSASKATKALLGRFTAQLERVMWRSEDIAAECDMLQHSLEVGNLLESDVESTLACLTSADTRPQINITIQTLDGSCQSVPIQPRYISALDLNHFGDHFDIHEDSVSSFADVADLKLQIQKHMGVAPQAQVLYYCGGGDTATDLTECDALALEDHENIAALQSRGFEDGHSLYLIVDSARHYWNLHARLAGTFRKALTAGYKAMLSLMPVASSSTHSRAVKFCKTCRRALAFLNESRATHKTRTIDVVEKVEKHMVDTILPILRAVATRIQIMDDNQVLEEDEAQE